MPVVILFLKKYWIHILVASVIAGLLVSNSLKDLKIEKLNLAVARVEIANTILKSNTLSLEHAIEKQNRDITQLGLQSEAMSTRYRKQKEFARKESEKHRQRFHDLKLTIRAPESCEGANQWLIKRAQEL